MNNSGGSIDQRQPDQMGSDMDQQQDPEAVNPDDQSASGQNGADDQGDVSTDDSVGESAQDDDGQLDTGSKRAHGGQSDQSDQSDQDTTQDSGD